MSADNTTHQILMSMPGTLRLDCNGAWYHDGVLVSHPGVAAYFTRHVSYSEEHAGFVILVENRCVRIEVEDTAFFVVSIALDETPMTLTLRDGRSVPFDPAQLTVSRESVLYYTLTDGHEARLLRSVIQQLFPYIESDGEAFYLSVGGTQTRLRERKTDV